MEEVTVPLPEGMTQDQFNRSLQNFLTKESTKAEGEAKVFKEFPAGDNQVIRVERSYYKGKEFLSTRRYWCTNLDPELKPGKGLTFQYEHIEDLIEGLESMKEWLEDNPNA